MTGTARAREHRFVAPRAPHSLSSSAAALLKRCIGPVPAVLSPHFRAGSLKLLIPYLAVQRIPQVQDDDWRYLLPATNSGPPAHSIAPARSAPPAPPPVRPSCHHRSPPAAGRVGDAAPPGALLRCARTTPADTRRG